MKDKTRFSGQACVSTFFQIEPSRITLIENHNESQWFSIDEIKSEGQFVKIEGVPANGAQTVQLALKVQRDELVLVQVQWMNESNTSEDRSFGLKEMQQVAESFLKKSLKLQRCHP